MTAMGALMVRGSESVHTYTAPQQLDVPGRPEAIFTAGHTHGHCSLLFAERGALWSATPS
jgi:glyoxylase-like metal-dependent hydrolase (beta-lactamase superfamily II)